MAIRNQRNVQMRQMRNPRNYGNELFRQLTRLFSGPLVTYRRQTERALNKKKIDKYASRFHSASGQQFKRNLYNPFEYLSLHNMVDQQRAMRYADFNQMEFNPDLASALNLFAEEITSYSQLEPMLRIKCANEEIKEVLHVLYNDILNLPSNLFGWTRNMCKYGDFFLYLDIEEGEGVKTAIGLPSAEIERLEGEDPENPNYVQFQWNTGQMTFENWQVAHFRILGNDKFAQYGTSVLDAARRIWKQLDLLESAMLAYRVVRSPERRVFYIDVGNIPPEEVQQYMEKIMTSMKRNQVVDATTGQADLRYNPMCFEGETRIPLLDGRNLAIKDLVEKWEAGERNLEVYSIDHEKGGSYAPGEIIWAGKSGHVQKLIEVELDDGGKLRVTPDHKMMLRDGNPIKAKDLAPGTSLMPFYTKKQYIRKDQSNLIYEQVFDPQLNKYVFTHRMVVASNNNIVLNEKGGIGTGEVVHHIDCNRFNNSSKNLRLMGWKEHILLHSETGKKNIIKYNKSEIHSRRTIERNKRLGLAKHMGEMYNGTELHKSHNALRAAGMKAMWKDPEKRKQIVDHFTFKFDNVCIAHFIRLIKSYTKYVAIDEFSRAVRADKQFVEYFTEINKTFKRNPLKAIYRQHVRQWIQEKGYKDYRAFVTCFNPNIMGMVFQNNYFVKTCGKPEKKAINHKVVSITEIYGEFDVYNVTVDRFANLAVQAPNMANSENEEEREKGKVQSFQSLEEDYYLPVRGVGSQTKIESLPGGQYTGDIDDVKYLRDKLFSAIGVPMSYLARGSDGSEDKASLSSADIRFARTIQRLQQPVISELEKVGMIHLYTKGYRGEDLISFTLALNNPSKVAELQELEQWRTKFDVAGAATEGYFSRRWISEKFFNLSDEEFVRNQRELWHDRIMDAKFEELSTPPDSEGGAGGDTGLDSGGGGDDEVIGLDDEPDVEGKDDVLLASPETSGGAGPAAGPPPEEVGLTETEKPHVTPGSKGKEYTYVDDDKRDLGSRLRSMKGAGSLEKASSTSRNVFPGVDKSTIMERLEKSLIAPKRASYNENEEKTLERSEFLLSEIMTKLNKKGRK
ncbi:MAG: portal protein [Magnetococcus sp. WYHC-3]